MDYVDRRMEQYKLNLAQLLSALEIAKNDLQEAREKCQQAYDNFKQMEDKMREKELIFAMAKSAVNSHQNK